MALHIVLYQPEIPHNTGAVGRLCLATDTRLHLIHPLGFSLEDKHLKRVGLDYWQDVDVMQWPDWETFLASVSAGARLCYLTTKTKLSYWDASFPPEEELYLVFGPETRGLPASLLEAEAAHALTIPMKGTRSLNLATSVAIMLYEAVRQRSMATTC
jgi:tRNA (cytidine/uridine-2'-O-)-methyltransferase